MNDDKQNTVESKRDVGKKAKPLCSSETACCVKLDELCSVLRINNFEIPKNVDELFGILEKIFTRLKQLEMMIDLIKRTT